jgi:FKBP-type peptidyl-prolyl cis-trans isomerase (trigger factor)
VPKKTPSPKPVKDDHAHDHDHAGHDHSAHQPDPDSMIGPNTIVPLTLAWKTIEPVYQEVLKNSAKRVKTAGFRPGKVPTKIAAEMIGQERLVEETLKKVLPPVYQAALKTKDLHPLTQPEFRPTKLEMGSDWEVEAHIAEKPEIKVKGFEKLAKKGKAEAEKEIKDLAKTKKDQPTDGQDATEPKAADDKEIRLRHIFRELVQELKPKLPELLIKEETRAELERLARSLNQVNLTLDDYLARRQISFEHLSAELATQVMTQLQLEFILEQISDEQKMTATEADFKPYLDRITDEKTKKQYSQDPEYKAYLTRVVNRQKVLDYLLSL